MRKALEELIIAGIYTAIAVLVLYKLGLVQL